MIIPDEGNYHTSNEVKEFVERHRDKIQLFFLPPHSPKLNPDKQVWNQIKHCGVEKKPIKNKRDLEHRLYIGLEKLQKNIEIIRSFFKLPTTQYADLQEAPA